METFKEEIKEGTDMKCEECEAINKKCKIKEQVLFEKESIHQITIMRGWVDYELTYKMKKDFIKKCVRCSICNSVLFPNLYGDKIDVTNIYKKYGKLIKDEINWGETIFGHF